MTTEQANEVHGRRRQPPATASPRGPSRAQSWEGRELRWAIVGQPRPPRLQDRWSGSSDAAQTLRDPNTPAGTAQIAERFPAILWVASNVHGGEESGTEGSLRVLYELADRDDCAARQILDNAIVVMLPIQNPDGREADTVATSTASTSTATGSRARSPRPTPSSRCCATFPAVLFIDDHEMGGDELLLPAECRPGPP